MDNDTVRTSLALQFTYPFLNLISFEYQNHINPLPIFSTVLKMLFDASLTALACFVTLSLCSTSDDSSKPVDGYQVPLSVDNGGLSEATYRACIAAPNCETYQSDQGTKIRFRAGHEPGSAAFKQRFGASNATMSVPLPGENAPNTEAPRKSDNVGSVHTNIDMSDAKIS